MTAQSTFAVIVSNLGTVHAGDDESHAVAIYEQYKADSINVIGQAAGESVTLTYKGDPIREYVGVIGQPTNEAPTGDDKAEGNAPCPCVRCAAGRALLKALGKIQPTIVVEVSSDDKEALDAITRGYIEAVGMIEGVQVRNHDALKAAIIAAVVEHSAGGATLTECLDAKALAHDVQAQGAKASYPSPYRDGYETDRDHTEFRTPAMPATVQVVEGDGGDALTVRTGGKEYVIALDVQAD